MSRRKKLPEFQARFELLESRDLMAADSPVVFSSAAFLASHFFSDGQVALHEVGASTAGGGGTTTSSVGASVTITKTTTTTVVSDVSWCNQNLHDAALRSLVSADVQDHILTRQEMLNIFSLVEKDATVSTNEFSDLRQIVGKTSFFAGEDYVKVLSIDVVVGNYANAHYQGSTLGNLFSGSSGAQLDKLVHKWFLGTDHPTAMSGTTYQKANGSLFPHDPVYTDVHQGALGDCYYLASLGETALVSPSLIKSMFIVNGDGTYTVRFNHSGVWEYVTVDSMLPATSSGRDIYANYGMSVTSTANPLWVALAEKAYAQMNESGWLRTFPGTKGVNSYDALSGGFMFDALNQITARASGYSAVSQTNFVTAFSAHKLITFGSTSSPSDGVVGGHAYAVVSYNTSTRQVTLFNPWGINNGSAPGLVTLNWTQMQHDFGSMQFA
jgi:hypothetical protein